MAMNKKEQAALDEAKKMADLRYSLRWTSKERINHDLHPEYKKTIFGYSFNTHNERIYPEWSQLARHGSGHPPEEITWKTSASQNGVSLYSTKQLALKALRFELEIKFAETLRRIDNQIDECEF
jgi:hypothetical protein